MASVPANLNDIRALIDQDRKKAALLAVLTLAFIVILARSFGGGKVAAETAAAILPTTTTTTTTPTVETSVPSMLGSPEVRAWMETPLPPLKRNVFVLDLTRYPIDESVAATADQGAATEVEAFDATGNLDTDRVRLAARELQLQQVWITPDPARCSAVIDGKLVRPGQTIHGFRLVRVDRNGAVVERDGVEVTVKMRRD